MEVVECIKCGKPDLNGLCKECQQVKCRVCGKVFRPNIHRAHAGKTRCPSCRKVKGTQNIGIPVED